MVLKNWDGSSREATSVPTGSDTLAPCHGSPQTDQPPSPSYTKPPEAKGVSLPPVGGQTFEEHSTYISLPPRGEPKPSGASPNLQVNTEESHPTAFLVTTSQDPSIFQHIPERESHSTKSTWWGSRDATYGIRTRPDSWGPPQSRT